VTALAGENKEKKARNDVGQRKKGSRESMDCKEATKVDLEALSRSYGSLQVVWGW